MNQARLREDRGHSRSSVLEVGHARGPPLCLPYAKSQVHQRGYRCKRDQDMQHGWGSRQPARRSARLLTLWSRSSSPVRRSATGPRLMPDPAGPWWSGTRDLFCELDSYSHEWILSDSRQLDERQRVMRPQSGRRDGFGCGRSPRSPCLKRAVRTSHGQTSWPAWMTGAAS